ncbi:hypothetical protein [Blautia massiliensis (ex Durand et al. 2017)]|uniref:hypothetical protein n=1 Tax=Blautia massiliensis (ex Durand et al. 2017) TaxID=1737424 RepID=UPI00242DA824|nr:hypothetical protein [Blautia massiliensis (ex Durand et al. 2017)]MDD6548074.1 hypothetical protein [Blautia massiliensis (ex Durand et al. 2017)]
MCEINPERDAILFLAPFTIVLFDASDAFSLCKNEWKKKIKKLKTGVDIHE